MAYITADQLRTYINDTLASDSDLALFMDAATSAVDQWCHRTFTADSVATARRFKTNSTRYVLVDDIYTTTGLVVKSDSANDQTFATTITDYQVEPYQHDTTPIYLLRSTNTFFDISYTDNPTVEVTAKWGWASVPKPVEMATLILAGRYYRRKDASFGVVGFPDGGATIIPTIDKDVKDLLSPYVKLVCP